MLHWEDDVRAISIDEEMDSHTETRSTVIKSKSYYLASNRGHTKASVIPRPARKMGVSPTLGLIVVPTKGPTGVCYDYSIGYMCYRYS